MLFWEVARYYHTAECEWRYCKEDISQLGNILQIELLS